MFKDFSCDGDGTIGCKHCEEVTYPSDIHYKHMN